MLYKNIKSYPALGRKLLYVGLGILATSCGWKSPPLTLRPEAKQLSEIATYPAISQKSLSEGSHSTVENKPIKISEKPTKTTLADMQKAYLSPKTDQANAKLIMNELVKISSYEDSVPLLIKRIGNTKEQELSTIELTAYNDLLTTFFKNVSASKQLEIISFVKKVWKNNDPFKEITYSALMNTMSRSTIAKTKDIQDLAKAFLDAMNRSGDPVIIACQSEQYDKLEKNGYSSETLYATGGSRE